MPPGASTRSAAKVEDTAPSRPARTTRAAVSKSKKPELPSDQDDEGLAKEMERVLRVSEPEPQGTTRAPRTAGASKTKALDVEKEVKKPTARTTTSRTTVKASSTTTAPIATTRRPVTAKTSTTASSSRYTETATKTESRLGPAPRPAPPVAKSTDSPTEPTTKPSSSVRESAVKASSNTTAQVHPAKVITTAQRASTTASTSKAAPSTAPRATSSVKQPVASASRPSAVAKTASAALVRQSTSASTRPVVSLKGKEKEREMTELSIFDYPWADPSTPMSSNERAQAAMAAFKESLASLSKATQAGYTYGAVNDTCDVDRVGKEMDVCDTALRILREIDEKGQLQNKGVEVERAGQAIVSRSIILGMPRRAFDQLKLARVGLMRQYKYQDRKPPIPTASQSATSTHPIPTEWLVTGWLPCPEKPDDMPNPLRILCIQHVLAAWSCLIGLEGYGYDLLPFKQLIGKATSSSDWISPMSMALPFSAAMCAGPCSNLTRRLNYIPRTAPHWPHVFATIVDAYVLTTTSDEVVPPGCRTPDQLWTMLRKWLEAYLPQTGIDLERIAITSSLILKVMDWTDEVFKARKNEEREKWHSPPSFKMLLEFWVDIARKIGDSAALARALGSMSTSIPEGVSSSSTTPSISMDIAEAHLNRLYGQLSLVETTLAGHAKTPDLALVIKSLEATQWDSFSVAVPALNNDSKGKELFDRSFRSFERSKSLARDLHHQVGTDERPPVHRWLFDAVSAVEKGLTGSKMATTSTYLSFIHSSVGIVSSLLARSSVDTESSTVLETIAIGERLSLLPLETDDRATCLKFLAFPIYNFASALASASRWQLGALVGQHSVEFANKALENVRDQKRLEKDDWKPVTRKRCSMYANWSSCLLNEGKGEEALSVVLEALSVLPPNFYRQLEASDSLESIKTACDSSDAAYLPYVRKVVAHTLCSDVEPISTDAVEQRAAKVLDSLASSGLSEKVRSILAEMVFESVLERAYKEDSLRIAFVIGRGLLPLLGNADGMRKLRLLCKMTLLISSSGIHGSDFEALVSQASGLIDSLERSKSGADATLTAEYHAIILMVQAFQAYQINEDPTPHVVPLAVQAIVELRELLVPPTKASDNPSPRPKETASTIRGTSKVVRKPPGKTTVISRSISASAPASKATSALTKRRRSSVMPIAQFDDVPRLTSMLTSLVSLLGLLGHVTAKIDGIKVLRALIRHQEESVNEYVEQSAELASIYSKLGKHTRAATVFSQVLRTISDKPGAITAATQLAVHLRHCEHLASQGEEAQALSAFADAEAAFHLIEDPVPPLTYRRKIVDQAARHTRLADAYRALASIRRIQDDAAGALGCLRKSVTLNGWAVASLALLATDRPKPASQDAAEPEKQGNENPFVVAPAPADQTGANQPTKDQVKASKRSTLPFDGKYIFGVQWRSAENTLAAYIDLADAYAQRGSAYEAYYYLRHADATARAVRSSAGISRAATKSANLRTRMQQIEVAQTKIDEATDALTLAEGPDMFDLQRVKGDLLAKQELAEEANEVFEAATKGIHGLDTVFSAADALLPTPKKEALARASLSLSTMRANNEPLLPSTLSHVLRRQAWLFREAGLLKESDELYKQVKLLQTSGDSKAEESYLAGKLALDDAFHHFQSDLFMSSLTESTIAMPMGSPGKKVDHRQSTRHRIQIILAQADQAYQSALTLVAGSGRVEDVRQACLSLALLRAFQTSLGQGGAKVTSFAADLLASSTSIGLHRELLEAIESKFVEVSAGTIAWPKLDKAGAETRAKPSKVPLDPEAEEDVTTNPALVEYWDQVRARHTSRSYLSPDAPSYDLSVLPETWAVVSMSVTEDRNTMFISRHQNGHEPLVFCLPLDRQSKREGEEEDVFTFEAGLAELKAIIKDSDECSSTAKTMKTPEDKLGWWATKRALDKRMKELIDNVEFCWLGAFKTIFNPRQPMSPERLQLFRGKIEKVFNLALFGSAHDSKKHGKVHLSDALLECFATLSSKSRDEEIEDFVYFILDIYQFHGVPVAVAELDLDQVGIDVITALTEMEASVKVAPVSPQGPEHLLLALDKNVQAFPWESIPCLRGRPVSRVPSLPVLLDQVALGRIMQPDSARRKVNSKKTHFILNPSGDLKITQAKFEPYLQDMRERSGWRGSIAQPPTEMEMRQILEGNELVLYFGHGGGEQYINGAKIRALSKCATVFLWGCSSGKLEDQGDLDPAGTAWNYMMAGCPSLTATLWDVTDRDIDRLTHAVYKRLGLDPAHMIQQDKPRAEHSDPGLLPLSGQGLGLSTVEAVNASREDCKMTYLTGAAVVHYGIPVYLY